MPYTIQKDGDRYCVHKETADGDAGERVACHDSRSEAEAQMRALYANEPVEAKSDSWYWNEMLRDNKLDADAVPFADYAVLNVKYVLDTIDWDAIKAGRRLQGAKLRRVREAFDTLSELLHWAEYGDREQDESETTMDEKSADLLTVKALGGNRVGGYGVLWGTPEQRDLVGEYFTADTSELDAIYKAMGRIPTFYHHGMDENLKSSVVGVVDVMASDDVGLWLETQLEKAGKYTDAIMQMVRRGALGWSTGTMPGARKVAGDGHIKRWPIVEATLTPTPAEPRMRLERPITEIKAAFDELGMQWPDDNGKGAEDARQDQDAIAAELERLNLLDL